MAEIKEYECGCVIAGISYIYVDDDCEVHDPYEEVEVVGFRAKP